MNDDMIEIDVGIGLNDSELSTYSYNRNEDKLVIELQAWDASVVQISCFKPLLFIDAGCGEVIMLCQKKSNSSLLKTALEKNFDIESMSNYPLYRHFLLLDIDENPSLEIICENIQIERVK